VCRDSAAEGSGVAGTVAGKAEQASSKIGKRVLMGQHKWDFMLSVMIGIHVRVRLRSLFSFCVCVIGGRLLGRSASDGGRGYVGSGSLAAVLPSFPA
jgi:hypothetical protein